MVLQESDLGLLSLATVFDSRGCPSEVVAHCSSQTPLSLRENNSLWGRKFGTALFKAETCLSQHDFISVAQGDAFARALRDWNHGAIPNDGGSMGAPIIEQAEYTLLGIELNVGMSPRNGRVWEPARRLGTPRHSFV